VPPGVVNYVSAADPRAAGEQFLQDERVAHVSFTGSVETGKVLSRLGASSLVRLSLELGGHNPFIVLADSDVPAAAAAAVHARLRNAGQTCVSPNRIYVDERVHDEFVDACCSHLDGTVVGDGFAPATTIGPLIDGNGAGKVQRHISDALEQGATIRWGGEQVNPGPRLKGHFMQPTLITSANPNMLVLQEETFGPVAAVAPFADVSQAIAWANDSTYGLAAYVYANSAQAIERLTDEIEAGMVVVNQPTGSGVQAPQGGIKQSGHGLEGGREGLEEFTYQKYVSTAY
jgi:succinate-semialdehyde dehydrogenase / glutarate-semialdehyde dehydrogenase